MIGGWWQSGTRLKPRTFFGTDGSRVPTGMMLDTELSVECAFGYASDAKIRCLPKASVWSAYYSDATCATKILVTSCAPTTGYVVVPGGSCVPYASFVHELGPSNQLSTVYIGDGVNCVPTSVTTGTLAYSIGALVPPTTFVEATVETEP